MKEHNPFEDLAAIIRVIVWKLVTAVCFTLVVHAIALMLYVIYVNHVHVQTVIVAVRSANVSAMGVVTFVIVYQVCVICVHS